MDQSGTVHLIYTRDGDLLYQNNSSGLFALENEVTVFDAGLVFNAAIGASAAGKVFVTYETQGRLVLWEGTGGVFEMPDDVATGGVAGSSLFVSSDGRAIMAYSLQGDIYVAFDFPVSSQGSIQVTDTPEVESSPDVQVNVVTGDVHVIYLRDDRVYYTNNTPPPTAAFDVDPSVGVAPLEVEFTDQSSGQVHTREWDFGDGGSSNEVHPTHVYEGPGEYTATLRVTGPGGSDEVSQVITVQSKVDFMIMPPVETFVGATGHRAPIFGTFTQEITGFSAAGRWNLDVLSIRDMTLDPSYASIIANEQFGWFIDNSIPGQEFFVVGAVFSLPDPMTGQGGGGVLPPATNARLVNIIIDIHDDISPQSGSFISLEDGVGAPSDINLFTGAAQSAINPGLVNHPMNIRSPQEYDALPQVFRGDADGSGSIDFTDSISLLDYLFLGRFQITCLDRADVDDTGAVDVTDAINLLVFLFLGGEPPKPPWPDVGPDPTEDDLEATNCDL